jgi:hypothetical protein
MIIIDRERVAMKAVSRDSVEEIISTVWSGKHVSQQNFRVHSGWDPQNFRGHSGWDPQTGGLTYCS